MPSSASLHSTGDPVITGPAAPPNVEIMTFGDELLYGQVIDTNSAFMGQEQGKIGLRVCQISSISDRAAEIVVALDQARQRAQVVLITGGLGPTKDDLTKHVLARYFNTELVMHEPTLHHVEEIFKRFQRPMLDVNRQQALVPANCEVLHNAVGTAPGMWFTDQGTVFVSNRTQSNVYAVIDAGGKRTVKTMLKGMTNPNGITFNKIDRNA